MPRTLPAAITTGKVGNSERVILIRIIPNGGDVWSELRWATKALTVTDWEEVEDDDRTFVGDVLCQGGLGTIEQMIDVEMGGDIGKVNKFDFEISNPEYSGSDRFDETFESYNLEGRQVEIRLAFWTGSNPAWTNTALLQNFIVEDIEYNYGRYKISCSDAGYQRHKDIPNLVLSKNDYTVIPVHNRGKTVPLVYGDLTAGSPVYSTLNLVPAIRVDKGKEKFVIARNKVTNFSLTVYLYYSDVNRYVLLTPASGNFSLTRGRPSYLLFPMGVNIYGVLVSQLETQGIQTNPTTIDGHYAIDESGATVVELDALINNRLYFKCPMPSEFGKTASGTYNVDLYVQFGTIPDDGSDGKIRRYDPETDAYVDLYTYDHSDSGDLVHVAIDGKTWSELSSYEYGVTVYNGTCEVANMYIVFDAVLVKLTVDRVTILPISSQGKAPRRGTSPFGGRKTSTFEAFNQLVEADNVCLSLDGGEFSAWIDADSRDNGYNEGNLITRPPYVIESILRDELGLTSSEIDYNSFDTLGNTTDGERKDWAFGNQIESTILSQEAIRNICSQAGMIYLEDYQNKSKIVSLIEHTEVKTIDWSTIYRDSPQVKFSKLQNVYNAFTLNYDRSWTTGGFNSTRYLNSSATNMTSNVRSGTPNTYTGLCGDSEDAIGGVTRELKIDCDWIRDDTTIDLLLKWLAEWLCYRKYIFGWSSGLDHVELEIGDQVLIDHTLLPTGVSNSAHFMIFEINYNLNGDTQKFKAIEIPSLLP